jgi:HEAT repeat protein
MYVGARSNMRAIVLFKACIIAIIFFPVVSAGLGAAAQGNLSSKIETGIKALADPNPDIRRAIGMALAEIGPAAV